MQAKFCFIKDTCSKTRVVNGLCKKFGAPDYARTDRSEVRTHRMALFIVTPDLTTIDRSELGNGSKGRRGINTKMSPIEAANVTMSLLYQKVFNEGYQKDAGEREAQRKARRSAANLDTVFRSETPSRASPRTEEMLKIVRGGGVSLIFPGRSKQFAHKSLDILGIPR